MIRFAHYLRTDDSERHRAWSLQQIKWFRIAFPFFHIALLHKRHNVVFDNEWKRNCGWKIRFNETIDLWIEHLAFFKRNIEEKKNYRSKEYKLHVCVLILVSAATAVAVLMTMVCGGGGNDQIINSNIKMMMRSHKTRIASMVFLFISTMKWNGEMAVIANAGNQNDGKWSLSVSLSLPSLSSFLQPFFPSQERKLNTKTA